MDRKSHVDAETADRLYICKNKQHYIWSKPKDNAIWCELCNKIFTYDECKRINTKTMKPYQEQLSGMISLTVQTKTNKAK